MNFIPLGKSIYNNEDLFPKNYSKQTFNNINIGNKSSDFKILKLLGKGALGKVYKVRSIKDNQIYAMKIFDKELETINKNLNIKLSHPNIVKIYNHFEENKKVYVIMEYFANGNLRDFITLNNHKSLINILSDNQIINFILQAIWALYYIQEEEGYFLGNIKPENILIDDNLNIKYGEFLYTITKDEDISKNAKHPYEKINKDNKEINNIWKRTKRYLAINWKCKIGDIYSLGLVLKELLENDCKKSQIQQILYAMCDEGSLNNETLALLFLTITNIFTDEQKNSSIESVVLCLKSFINWSKGEIIKEIPKKINKTKTGENEMTTEFYQMIKSKNVKEMILRSDEIDIKNIIKKILDNNDNNAGYENKVVKKYNEVLNLLYDEDGNGFINWYKYINELRLELNKEIDDLETLNEIDPNDVYLYLVNIIINEIRNNYLKKEENNGILLNIKNVDNDTSLKYFMQNNIDFECPGIQKILGLMRKKSKCLSCNLIKYKFNNYILIEIDPKKFLKEKIKNEDDKNLIDIEQFFNEENIPYTTSYECSQCHKETKHTCTNEIYSLPESLTISIKGGELDQKNYIKIKETIEIKDLNTNNENKKTYELVALLKYNRERGKTLYYTFSKFGKDYQQWFICQSYKGIEEVNMNESHLRSKNVKMLFYQEKKKIN